MKKYLIILLILVISLIGCGKNERNSNEMVKGLTNKKEIFSKFLKEKDLSSYEGTFSTKLSDKKGIYVLDGFVEMIKNPMTYHLEWKEKSGSTVTEGEDYLINGKVRFNRRDNGKWEKENLNESMKNTQEEEKTFVSSTDINPDVILESLVDYFKITESGKIYIVELNSTSENIDEIKNILFDQPETYFSYGELTSLKLNMTFQKDNYYPVSFELKSTFFNKDNDNNIEVKQTGSYEKVNKLKNIEIPEELKSL